MPSDVMVSQMTSASQVNTNDLIMVVQPEQSSETGYTSRKTTALEVADKVVNGIEYSSDLQTTDKTITGAINEVKEDVDPIGTIYRGEWTASSSSSLYAQVTESIILPPGVYSIQVVVPTVSSNINLALNIYDSNPDDFLGFMVASTYNNAVFYTELTEETEVYAMTFNATATNYTNITRGYIKAIRIR